MNNDKTITLNENEEMVMPILWTGMGERLGYNIRLSGKNARVKVLALLVGRGESSLRLDINVIHEAKDTRSEVIVKGILGDLSKVDARGMVRINKGAKGSNANLSSDLLLFSSEARGEAVPGLEILENDVKAGHSSTVGRINDEELFYLMSRGLSKSKARQLIVQGFLTSILEEFPEDLSGKAKEELKLV